MVLPYSTLTYVAVHFTLINFTDDDQGCAHARVGLTPMTLPVRHRDCRLLSGSRKCVRLPVTAYPCTVDVRAINSGYVGHVKNNMA